MSHKRFGYALEPVRTLRRWRLDEAVGVLAERTAAVDAQRAALTALGEELARVRKGAADAQRPGRDLDLRALTLAGQYLADALRRQQDMEAELVRLDDLRDAALSAMAEAHREQEAINRHRDAAWQTHRAAGAVAAVNMADEHWIVLQGKGHELDH